MSEPPGHGDDDPAARFSHAEFRHGYAGYPAGALPPEHARRPAPAWRTPAPRRPSRRESRRESRRRRRLAILITLILLAMIAGLLAGLVASLAHLKREPATTRQSTVR